MKPEESIYAVKCGAYFTLVLLYSLGWKQIEIMSFGHNFNREIGGYDTDAIDKPVCFGYPLLEPNMRPIDVLVGNGITVIHLSDDVRMYSHENSSEYDKLNSNTKSNDEIELVINQI